MLSAQTTVIRAGRRYQLPAQALVPGDVVFVQSGDRVPADLRLFRLKELRIEEAILTGESVPVTKHIEPVREDAPLGDRRCLAFSGTLVTYGQGTGVVIETGMHTEIGRISAMLTRVRTLTTPLMRQLASFARWLTGAILIIVIATVIFGTLVRDYQLGEMFLAAVGLAVAAIPEGLPAVITIALAIKPAEADQRTLRFEDVNTGLVLLGLVGIIDPPREEAISAVAQCRAAGIQVKMITGDHAGTATAVAAQMGLDEHRRALTGVDLEQMDDSALHQVVENIDVFARASPEHKLRLVQALQTHGRVVAMTGGGQHISGGRDLLPVQHPLPERLCSQP
jgi:magnesium-transporting ATPase (P-type)